MKITNKILTVFAIIALFAIEGCDDFLHVDSDSQKVATNSFKTLDDLRAATGYLYAKPWSQFNTSFIGVLEARANNVSGTGTTGDAAALCSFVETGDIGSLKTLWQSLYIVITQSDYVINKYAPITRQYVDTADVNACEGEARFMRATAYWYLAMTWHDAPIIDDPETYISNYSIYPNRFEDLIQYAINDLTYAVTTLPLTDDAGRVTKYSAEGMLARVCLTAADFAAGGHFSSDYLTRNNVGSNDELANLYFSKVKTLTHDVIVNGGQYGLMDDYEEMFRVQNNNNKESLFSLQFVPGSSDVGNGNGSLAYSSDLTGGLNAWSGSTYCSFDIVHLSALDKGKSRSRGNIFMAGESYSYLSYLANTTYTGTKCNIKKQVVGSTEDADGAINGNSGLMTPMLRMADVYLMYTEACIGTGTETNDQIAVDRYNAVHERAFYCYKDSTYNPYKAKSVIERDTLFKERRLEFFLEALFWPDIVRRSFYDLDWVTKYLNNKLYRSEYTLTGSPLVTDTSEYHITSIATSLTNFRWFTFTYNPTNTTSEYTLRYGFSTNSPRLDATFNYYGTAYHNDVSASYVHATNMDNIWALPYPTVEVTQNPLLIAKPINYNF
jgi:starch-binding outer membrane protein, SusD/RagB family